MATPVSPVAMPCSLSVSKCMWKYALARTSSHTKGQQMRQELQKQLQPQRQPQRQPQQLVHRQQLVSFVSTPSDRWSLWRTGHRHHPQRIPMTEIPTSPNIGQHIGKNVGQNFELLVSATGARTLSSCCTRNTSWRTTRFLFQQGCFSSESRCDSLRTSQRQGASFTTMPQRSLPSTRLFMQQGLVAPLLSLQSIWSLQSMSVLSSGGMHFSTQTSRGQSRSPRKLYGKKKPTDEDGAMLYRADRVLANRSGKTRSECFQLLLQKRVRYYDSAMDGTWKTVTGPSAKVRMDAVLQILDYSKSSKTPDDTNTFEPITTIPTIDTVHSNNSIDTTDSNIPTTATANTNNTSNIRERVNIPPPPPLLCVYHKPKWVLSATVDTVFQNRKCIDVVPSKMHLVGRLDYDSSGLLLFSSSGILTQAILHPKKNIEKTYVATVAGGAVDEHRLRTQLKQGVKTSVGIHTAKLISVEPFPTDMIRPYLQAVQANIPTTYNRTDLRQRGYLDIFNFHDSNDSNDNNNNIIINNKDNNVRNHDVKPTIDANYTIADHGREKHDHGADATEITDIATCTDHDDDDSRGTAIKTTALTNVTVIVSEGKHRMVRRILANCGHPVVDLKRIQIGPYITLKQNHPDHDSDQNQPNNELLPGTMRQATLTELLWARSLLQQQQRQTRTPKQEQNSIDATNTTSLAAMPDSPFKGNLTTKSLKPKISSRNLPKQKKPRQKIPKQNKKKQQQ